jgi:hypothetical protein
VPQPTAPPRYPVVVIGEAILVVVSVVTVIPLVVVVLWMHDDTVNSNALSDVGEHWTVEVLLNCRLAFQRFITIFRVHRTAFSQVMDLWLVTKFSIVGGYQNLGGIYCFSLQKGKCFYLRT